MANIVDTPGAKPVNISHINNTRAYLQSNGKPRQVFIETETGLLSHKDNNGTYRTSSPLLHGHTVDQITEFTQSVINIGDTRYSQLGHTHATSKLSLGAFNSIAHSTCPSENLLITLSNYTSSMFNITYSYYPSFNFQFRPTSVGEMIYVFNGSMETAIIQMDTGGTPSTVELAWRHGVYMIAIQVDAWDFKWDWFIGGRTY